ncbi:bromodomain-containing protein DDB_G0280777-like [Musca vetustissima]|uniref:bromodomain-containing protein DDB_G0280777-like n=1 Tax=Musca vetustissima TaxID=27455 RepID=UPI002AB6D633|nr:bromodomain-containing protein DDB_G0280777-like [Musca vetustissima]
MHLKLKSQSHQTDSSLDSKQQKRANRKSQNMASSLVNDDEDNASNATRNTQQQQPQIATGQTSNNNNQQSSNNNNNGASAANTSSATSTSTTTATTTNKMHPSEAKAKKENLQQRKLELEKLLNEKNWLLQQLQKQETEILNGNFEYMNFNDFLHSLNAQYKQEQATTESTITGGSGSIGGPDEAILRRKPLMAKENQQHHNVLHRRQSEISNRSSEYDNYPHQDNLSTHSEGAASGGGGGARGASGSSAAAMTMQHAQQAQQQYNAKSALKKRSATVAGTTTQQTAAAAAASNLQMLRQQQHMEQQLIQQHNLYKQQHHYHHPQQHLFKQHIEHHQVLMPHLQYATQKFYYTTLQPTTQPSTSSSAGSSQQLHQQQQQYGRYIKSNQLPQAQVQQQQLPQHHHAQQQSPNHSQQHHMNYNPQNSSSSNANHQHHHQQQQQQQLLLTPPGHGTIAAASSHMDNISLYSLNSNNVATLHRQAQQQQPVIVQCDKYYLSPTTHHVSHNDGGGFIKSSQNIKEYISPMNSPQQQQHHQMGTTNVRDKRLASQTNLSQRVNTPSIDAISLAPSYVSMETVDYMTIPTSQQQQRWKSQSNLPPPGTTSASSDLKSYSSDMLNNNSSSTNQYYNSSNTLQSNSNAAQQHPPHVTQVKPFKPLDDISINSGYSTETQKKTKSKQWLESSLDGPVIRQTPQHHTHNSGEENYHPDHNSNISSSQHPPRSKLSSHSLNTSRHYSMSAAAGAASSSSHSPLAHTAQAAKLSQSTSYLNQMDVTAGLTNNSPTPAPSISQAYNIEIVSPQTPMAYKFLPVSTAGNTNKPPARPPLYINATPQNISASPTTGLLSGVAGSSASALSPDIRVESPKNVTVVQPATFQPYKEVTKPFEMSDFYKYSTKYRQKENNNNSQVDN